MITQLAEEYSVEYLHIFPYFMSGDIVKEQYFSADLIHLNGEGYKTWMNLLSDYLY